MKQPNDLTAVIAFMIRFRKENIDVSYNKEYQMWLYKTSHEQDEIPEDEHGLRPIKFDENGFITNVAFSGKTKSGFDLLEQNFIDKELKRLNSIDVQSLDLDKQMYIAFLKEYFENKRPAPKTLEIEPKDYKAQYHVVSYILDCYANNKQLPTGKGWETAGEAREKYTKSGNTFYKASNEMDITKKTTKLELSNLLGNDWERIVVELSDDPKTLKTYLDTNM